MTFININRGVYYGTEAGSLPIGCNGCCCFFVGQLIRKKFSIFEKYCIPAPVIGGMLFALCTLALNLSDTMTVTVDDTMQRVFMTLFFTSIGFTASFKLLKIGGLQVIIFLAICTLLVILQNVLSVSLAGLFGLSPLLGLCVGSIPMIGGHGTAGSFGPLFTEVYGVEGATTVALAAATFGLVMGGVIGGPIAKRLIGKHNLKSHTGKFKEDNAFVVEEVPDFSTEEMLAAFSLLFIAAGIGTFISSLLQKTGMTFPSYIGAMLAAAVIRNISDLTDFFTISTDVVEILGNVSLSIFLSMALMSLKLWQLADLAVPLVVMLLGQTVLMALFAYFITFNIMGKDYEAAVMSSASCGFGMGATPNAIANMQAITSKLGPAPRAFFIVPLVGSLFIDFVNATTITIFVNFFAK